VNSVRKTFCIRCRRAYPVAGDRYCVRCLEWLAVNPKIPTNADQQHLALRGRLDETIKEQRVRRHSGRQAPLGRDRLPIMGGLSFTRSGPPITLLHNAQAF